MIGQKGGRERISPTVHQPAEFRRDRDLWPLWQIEGITYGAASQIDRVITTLLSSERETVETFSISLLPNAPRCSISNFGERSEGRRREKLVLQPAYNVTIVC